MINPIVGGLLSDVKAEDSQPGVPVINSAQGSPSAPSLLGLNNWRDAFVGPSGQPPQIPQPQMQPSPYMQATPLGNDTMGYGIDPVAFQGLLDSLMPPAPLPPQEPMGLLNPRMSRQANMLALFGPSSSIRGFGG